MIFRVNISLMPIKIKPGHVLRALELDPIDADHYNVYGNLDILKGITKPTVFMTLLKPNTANPRLSGCERNGFN